MKFKRIVLFALVITIAVVVGWGIGVKAHSPHQEDDPNTSPIEENVPSQDQIGNTLGIVLGGIAIVAAIGAGVGINYVVSKKERANASSQSELGS
ncbi:MAG: hypothetical protein U9O54_05500 [Chloroflexota bacterium]|nr:hypothetical protein [Chloroflexota bacterium]